MAKIPEPLEDPEITIAALKLLLKEYMNEHSCHFPNRHIHVDGMTEPCTLCPQARELLKD